MNKLFSSAVLLINISRFNIALIFFPFFLRHFNISKMDGSTNFLLSSPEPNEWQQTCTHLSGISLSGNRTEGCFSMLFFVVKWGFALPSRLFLVLFLC